VEGGGVHQRQQFWLQAIFSGTNFIAACGVAGAKLVCYIFCRLQVKKKLPAGA